MEPNLSNARVPVLGFTAPSGTGKTTLLSRILQLLNVRGLSVGVIKQARNDFDLDTPGKDSYRLRKAGVECLVLASASSTAWISEHRTDGEPSLNDLLPFFDQDRLDLILVEGFASQPFPKIELHRKGHGVPRYSGDPWIIALITDHVGALPAPVPQLDINDPAWVVEFVLGYWQDCRKSE